MNGLRPNGQRGNIAMTLIWIILVIDIFIFVFSVINLYLWMQISNGEEISETLAIICETALNTLRYLFIASYIVSAVTFICWFRRAYYNLGTITGSTGYGEGWAAGAWFVPIANLFIPYNIMKELYEKTDEYLFFENNETYAENRLTTKYIGWWWGLWVTCGILGNAMSRLLDKAETIEAIIFSNVFYTCFALLSILLSFVTVIVIKDYTDVEKQLINTDIKLKEEESPLSEE